MAEIPKDLLYTEDHEYVKTTKDPNIVAIGITVHRTPELHRTKNHTETTT